ncbi:NAD(P)/FAD-dependent oxidoreductase [Halobium salinum]|uniref:NAD(P)/FAD-dependent oxidoreductase n=1 Tax=Halobium salinum TaxID=1364940 RepID=A0ABD5PHF6_9EURY|nr:FAD-dependent oxidoreductase [Halobium salinum]
MSDGWRSGTDPEAFAPDLSGLPPLPDRSGSPDASGRRVAVVGAGAVGATAAGDLAVAGADVTLFDRGDPLAAEGPTAGSSGRAAGVLYDAFAEDVDARVADRALSRFRAFSGAGDFAFHPCPYVLLAREGDERRAAAVEEAVVGMRRHGRDVSLVDADGLRDRFPTLRTDDVGVAAVAEGAGWTDPGSYVRAVAERAVEVGVDLRSDCPVGLSFDGDAPAVTTEGDPERFDAVLVAAGAHTKALLADAGVPVPLKPYRVQALTSRAGYDGPMGYDATAGFYFRPHPTGLLAGDGTEPVEIDPDDWPRDADDWFVDDLRSGLQHRAGHTLDVDRAWAGLCVATPDRNPMVGELRAGLYVAAGWQGHGFMRAPATAEAAARTVLGGDSLPGFDPGRFDGSERFEVVEGMSLGEEEA